MAESLPPLSVRIAEAELALHRLMTGTPMVSVQYGDRQITYRNYATDIEKLQAYILSMKTEARIIPTRRPMGVIW